MLILVMSQQVFLHGHQSAGNAPDTLTAYHPAAAKRGLPDDVLRSCEDGIVPRATNKIQSPVQSCKPLHCEMLRMTSGVSSVSPFVTTPGSSQSREGSKMLHVGLETPAISLGSWARLPAK